MAQGCLCGVGGNSTVERGDRVQCVCIRRSLIPRGHASPPPQCVAGLLLSIPPRYPSSPRPLLSLSSPFIQPLFRAAALGHTRAVQMLLENGSSPDVRDNNGDTAAHVACNSHEFEIATILRDQLHDTQMIVSGGGGGWEGERNRRGYRGGEG